MKEIAQIRKLSLWIFLIPFISINLCLLISTNYSFLDNTVFRVDQIGRSGFAIPYLDGSLSISRASRTFPQFLIFKPAMIATSIMLYIYWTSNNLIVNHYNNEIKLNNSFKIFGIISAICLSIHSIFLGIEIDIKIFKLLRRVILLGFIIFEIMAQGLLVYNLYKLKKKIYSHINSNILILKFLLVSILAIVAILSIPVLANEGDVHFKHALEWNYFVGVILFYLLTNLFWRKTT